MRLREFKEPRQRIDEVVVAGIPLATYIYGLLIAGGAMIAGDPRTQKVIQKKVDQWVNSNPGEAQVYADQIKQGQDAGALPKDPSKIGDVAFPIVSALSSAWDWMTGGSTTGNKPAQPSDYVKDKNGMLRRKETAQEIQKKIGDVIASNTTRFDNQANAKKALPSLKDGTVVTIGGKTYKVSPDAGGVYSKDKRGFVPYKDMGKVTGKPVTGQVDNIEDFSVSPSTSAADDDDYAGTTISKPSAGSTNKSGPSWLDRASDAIGGVFNTVAGAVGGLFGSEDDVKPAPTKKKDKKDWSAKPSAGTVNKNVAGTADGDDIKVTVPPQVAPDINVDSDKPWDWSKPGSGTRPSAPGAIAGAPPVSGGVKDKGEAGTIAGAPPIARPGDEVGQGVQGATTGTGAEAGTGAQAGTGVQADTGTVANTQATTQAQTDTVATTIAQPTTAVAPPVTPPPVVVPPAKPKYKTEPYKDQDVFYTGWRKGPPKKVIRLR